MGRHDCISALAQSLANARERDQRLLEDEPSIEPERRGPQRASASDRRGCFAPGSGREPRLRVSVR